MRMTEQEVREKLEELERRRPLKKDCPFSPYDKNGLHYDPFTRNPICSKCFAEQVLTLFEQAGYLTPDEVQSMLNTLSGGLPDFLKELGYVQLDPDQSLPKSWVNYSECFEDKVLKAHYSQAQQDMLKAYFRKVKRE